MLRLVNQILDFRKIQNKKMKMQVQRVDVVPFVRKVMDNFEAVAEEHRIDFLFETEKQHLFLWVDVDKLEKIVFNLLSNAFKYTPNGKMITFLFVKMRIPFRSVYRTRESVLRKTRRSRCLSASRIWWIRIFSIRLVRASGFRW